MNVDTATIFEVGPRDGLQSLTVSISTQKKIGLVNALSECGFAKIETTSFVSPKWVPQLGDAQKVMQGIMRKSNVRYTALTPNLRGLEATLAAQANEATIFASESQGFSHANLNCSIDESLERYKPVLELAQKANLPVRGYLSSVIVCPFDGPVDPQKVLEVAQKGAGAQSELNGLFPIDCLS